MKKSCFRLIIVDDEEQARRGLAKYCDWAQLGFEVVATLEDGSDALAYLQNHRVDAILTDIQMFQVSGLELARRVHEQWPDIRVVILSGYNEIDYVHAAIQSEAVDFLVKPVKKEELIRAFAKVRKKLNEQAMEQRSLQLLVSPAVDASEAALAAAVADDRQGDIAACYQQWLDSWQGAPRITALAIIARLFKVLYQQLDQEGILLPEEWNQRAVYRQLDDMTGAPDMAMVYNLLMSIGEQRHALPAQEDLISRVQRWVNAHLSENFSLEDICAALFVSKGHLCREFKKATGDTVMGFVEKARMEKAKALLAQHKYSYTQLASIVGYKDSRYFRKVFAKYMQANAGEA